MIRKIAWLLVIAMLLSLPAAAFAVEYKPLNEKLMLQLRNGSGLTATVKLDMSPGASMTALDPTTNALLAALLPDSAIDVRYLRALFGANKDREELRLTLTKAGQSAGSLTWLSDGVMVTLASSLLGTGTYAAPRGDAALQTLLTGQKSTWPGIEGILAAINTTDLNWKTAAEAEMDRYTAKIGVWMQAYTKVANEKDEEGNAIIHTAVQIPPAAVKAEMKQLLMDFYQDAALQALLRQKLTAREAAAYLDRNMMNAFFSAIDALKMKEDVQITRVFNSAGHVIEDHIILPLGGFRGAEKLDMHTKVLADGSTECTHVLTLLPESTASVTGKVYTLSYIGGPAKDSPGDAAYKGTLSIVPESTTGTTFTVGEAGAQVPMRFAFNLNLTEGEETYTQTAKGQTAKKEYIYTLLVTPEHAPDVSPQSFRLKLTLSGGREDRAATAFEGSLAWQDMKTEGTLTASFTGTSAAPWNIPNLNLPSATRVDNMTETQLETLRQQLSNNLQAAITTLTAQFLVPAQ